MTDYSERVNALRLCARWHMADDALANAEQAAAAIEELQAQLPKRGEWIKRHEFVEDMRFDGFRCSICNWWKGDFETYNYCPNCGAKMNGEQNVE